MNETSQPPIIRTEQITKKVTSGQTILTILSDVNLEIQAAETLAIVGASGAGKSTLLSLLAGLDLPTSGGVYLNNQNLNRLDEDGRARLRSQMVGFIFQNFQLLPSLTALENVMLPLELKQTPQSHQVAKSWLSRVGLAERGHHYPHQLSGGEQQRVAIARAFATEPKLLFADEPTGNLDQQTGQNIIDLLFELNKNQQTTLVVVTHDKKLAERCERRITLVAGCVASHL
ncbi:MAG: transporter, ATPase subunit [Gammaproteobacteria bacterium]|jgi:putative ABC transport system ATP-binding protein|nr:transporter, ATPase subunit [Gammaproteobacteria bacterium]